MICQSKCLVNFNKLWHTHIILSCKVKKSCSALFENWRFILRTYVLLHFIYLKIVLNVDGLCLQTLMKKEGQFCLAFFLLTVLNWDLNLCTMTPIFYHWILCTCSMINFCNHKSLIKLQLYIDPTNYKCRSCKMPWKLMKLRVWEPCFFLNFCFNFSFLNVNHKELHCIFILL